jgi:hypothetical protein
MSEENKGHLLRNLLIEVVVYGILVVVYTIVVLRLLGEPLAQLFHQNLVFYALLSLGLILAQGVLLDFLTTFLLNRLKLGRPKKEDV